VSGDGRNRYRVPDARYKSGYRLTPEGIRARRKWKLLILAWIVLVFIGAFIPHAGVLPLLGTVGLIGYGVYRYRVNHTSLPPSTTPPTLPTAPLPASYRFNAPPGWPPPPAGWTPAPDWQPDPAWPPPPPGWQLWVPASPTGERRKRQTIPQGIKVAVAARDQGRCRCQSGVTCHGYPGICGSTEDPHYDHIIPWAKGGADTVANLQILCGPCNRRKGADYIPV
jgi:HNH endonuclease